MELAWLAGVLGSEVKGHVKGEYSGRPVRNSDHKQGRFKAVSPDYGNCGYILIYSFTFCCK